jgi:hypothetical protein
MKMTIAKHSASGSSAPAREPSSAGSEGSSRRRPSNHRLTRADLIHRAPFTRTEYPLWTVVTSRNGPRSGRAERRLGERSPWLPSSLNVMPPFDPARFGLWTRCGVTALEVTEHRQHKGLLSLGSPASGGAAR